MQTFSCTCNSSK